MAPVEQATLTHSEGIRPLRGAGLCLIGVLLTVFLPMFEHPYLYGLILLLAARLVLSRATRVVVSRAITYNPSRRSSCSVLHRPSVAPYVPAHIRSIPLSSLATMACPRLYFAKLTPVLMRTN